MKLQKDFVKPQKGFTLIELAVVLAVLVLVASLVVPTFPVLRKEKLKSESRRVANLLKNVLDEVIFKGKLLKLTLDKNKIVVSECVGNLLEREDEREGSELQIQVVEVCEWKERRKLELSVDISEIWVEGREFSGTEETEIIFSTYIPFVEILLSDGEKGLWVIFNPYTFTVEVSEKSARVEI